MLVLLERECRLHQDKLVQESSGGSNGSSDGVPLTQNPQDDNQQWQQAKEQMMMNGWCFHQVGRLSLKYDLKTFLYLATMERSPLRSVDHQRCILHESCVAYNTDPSTYRSRHTTADCACLTISVPYESLIKIIRQGNIPLVSIEDGDAGADEKYKLRVEARSWRSKYVAISHVWADGLGNPSKNGLPSCQIEQLRVSLRVLQKVCTDPILSRGPRSG